MSGVFQLVRTPQDKADALRVVESLRECIERGEIKAFVAVGVDRDHGTRMWCASTGKTTHLEILGAIHHLGHCYELDCMGGSA